MERNNPTTSTEAFKSVQPEMLAEHYRRILKVLNGIKIATYEEIAIQGDFTDKNQVSRRLKELEGMELVYKPGTKKPTSTGRNAYQYALRTQDTVVPPIEKFNNQEMKAADYASVLIAKTKQGKLIQKDLFNND